MILLHTSRQMMDASRDVILYDCPQNDTLTSISGVSGQVGYQGDSTDHINDMPLERVRKGSTTV